MSDRTLVEYEEHRNEHGPHWSLVVERSAAGQPGGLISIKFRGVDETLEPMEMTIVIDDLRRLQPAIDWASA